MPAVALEGEAARLSGLCVQPRLALAELEGAIRDGLMAFSCATGMLVIAEMMEAERTEIVGPKGRHDRGRAAERNGSAQGSVVLGGRTVPVSRRFKTATEAKLAELLAYPDEAMSAMLLLDTAATTEPTPPFCENVSA